MEAFRPALSPAPRALSPPIPRRSPSLSPHFHLTSSNYFRVIPASRRLKRDWETKPTAPPTDPSATQSRARMGLSLANGVPAATASGSNRAHSGRVLSEGRSCVYQHSRVQTFSLSHFQPLNGANVSFV